MFETCRRRRTHQQQEPTSAVGVSERIVSQEPVKDKPPAAVAAFAHSGKASGLESFSNCKMARSVPCIALVSDSSKNMQGVAH